MDYDRHHSIVHADLAARHYKARHCIDPTCASQLGIVHENCGKGEIPAHDFRTIAQICSGNLFDRSINGIIGIAVDATARRYYAECQCG